MSSNTAAITEELPVVPDGEEIFRITNNVSNGDQSVYLAHATNPPIADARRAAVYLQFRSEELYGEGAMLTNLGVAALLVQFYGFMPAARVANPVEIDLYDEREAMCEPGLYEPLMADKSLWRKGLKEAMYPHVLADPGEIDHARDWVPADEP